jgi:hypothetical protein
MSILRVLLAALALSAVTAAQQATSFPTEDGGLIFAELYGKGTRGAVLAHGGAGGPPLPERSAPFLRSLHTMLLIA